MTHQDDPMIIAILAGGQSRRMGQDKALIPLGPDRLIDRAIEQYSSPAHRIILSAPHDYDTGLTHIPDRAPPFAGPVNALFSVSAYLQKTWPSCRAFAAVPLDAPFAPDDMIDRLSQQERCAIAADTDRLHPSFGYWTLDHLSHARDHFTQLGEQAPSLHALAEITDARIVRWPDKQAFHNINRPEDLAEAQRIYRARN